MEKLNEKLTSYLDTCSSYLLSNVISLTLMEKYIQACFTSLLSKRKQSLLNN